MDVTAREVRTALIFGHDVRLVELTAKHRLPAISFGLTIPPSLVLRGDGVIQ